MQSRRFTYEGIVKAVSKVTYRVGTGFLAAMMFLTAADVLGRYALNKPVPGSLDLTIYMMVIMVTFSLPYCVIMKGNIRVDLVVGRFSPRIQAIIDSSTTLIGVGLFSWITWQCSQFVKIAFDAGIRSALLPIPIFPFVGIVAFGSALVTLALLVDFLDYLSQAVRR